MLRRRRGWLGWATVLCLCVGLVGRGQSDELDRETRNKNALLSQLAGALDKFGIDVLHSARSSACQLQPARPRLTLLSEFPKEPVGLKSRLTLTAADMDSWMQQFRDGAVGAIIALHTDEPVNDPRRFFELWAQAERDYWVDKIVGGKPKGIVNPAARVFIAYA